MGDETVNTGILDQVKGDLSNMTLSSILDEEFIKDNVLDISLVTKRAQDLLAAGQASLSTMNELSEWDTASEVINNIKTLDSFLIQVVYAVEAVVRSIDNAKEYITSEDKLDIAVEIVDKALTLPWYLEAVDGLILKMLISTTVTFINKIGGKDWDMSGILHFIETGKDILEK